MRKHIPEIAFVLIMALIGAGSWSVRADDSPVTTQATQGSSRITRALVYEVLIRNTATIAFIAETYRESHNGHYPTFTVLDSLTDKVEYGFPIRTVDLYETKSTQDSTGQDWAISYWHCPNDTTWFQLRMWGKGGEPIGKVNNFAEKRNQ